MLAVAGVEKSSNLVATAGGEVLLLEHMDYRGTIPADSGAPITCWLALTKAGSSSIAVAISDALSPGALLSMQQQMLHVVCCDHCAAAHPAGH